MLSLYSVDFIHIGRQLQKRRRTLGLTQDQIANQLSISTTQLSRIECGQRPSLLTLLQLTAILNMSLDQLFSVSLHADKTALAIHQCLMDMTEDQRLELLHFISSFYHDDSDPDSTEPVPHPQE